MNHLGGFRKGKIPVRATREDRVTGIQMLSRSAQIARRSQDTISGSWLVALGVPCFELWQEPKQSAILRFFHRCWESRAE